MSHAVFGIFIFKLAAALSLSFLSIQEHFWLKGLLLTADARQQAKTQSDPSKPQCVVIVLTEFGFFSFLRISVGSHWRVLIGDTSDLICCGSCGESRFYTKQSITNTIRWEMGWVDGSGMKATQDSSFVIDKCLTGWDWRINIINKKPSFLTSRGSSLHIANTVQCTHIFK